MKYVLILAAVVILVRIDLVINLASKGMKRLQNLREESAPTASAPEKEIVPLSSEIVKTTPRAFFFSLFANFRANPDVDNHQKVIAHLKSNLSLFNEKLDPALEAAVYNLRDLLQQRNSETIFLLMDLLPILQGENAAMVRRFLAVLLDSDVREFVKFYSGTKDTNCVVAMELPDVLPEEERLSELRERQSNIEAYLADEKADAGTKLFAQSCLTAVQVQIEKLKPLVRTAPVDAPAQPEEASTPTPTPTPTLTPAPAPDSTP